MLILRRPDDPAVHQRITDLGKDVEGMPVVDDEIGILSHGKAAETVIHAADPRGVDGDGTQGIPFPQALLGGQGRAKGEMLDAGDGMVGGDGHRHAGLSENPGGFEVGGADLLFVTGGKGGADDGGKAACGDLVGDEMAFGTVVEGQSQAKLLGDADGGEDVIGAVNVGLEGDLAVKEIPITFHSEGWLPVPLHVLTGEKQLLADEGSDAHAGGGAIAVCSVIGHGIFTKGNLDSGGGKNDHIVDAAPRRFDKGELPADGIGTAGPRQNAGDAHGKGVVKGAVHGIDAVDGAEIGGGGIGVFVGLIHLYGGFFLADAEMTVGVQKTGEYRFTFGVDAGHGVGGHNGVGDPLNLAVTDEKIAPSGTVGFHGI